MPKAKKKPVCDVCNDTHRTTRTKDCGDRYEVMCTSCPAPCRACRSGGNGPFCETTPCACSCHVGNWRYLERVATATAATVSATGDGVTSYPLPPCPECGGEIVMPPARCVGRCASPGGLDTTATRAVLDDVLAERGRQHAKWGRQDLPDGTTRDRDAVLRATEAQTRCAEAALLGTLTYRHILEEELTEAMAESDPERLRVELVQVAAVAVQWIEALDRQAKETTDA